VVGCTLLATWGHDLLPAVMHGSHYTPITGITMSGVWLVNLLALAALLRRRPYCVLDLWLIVTMCAWLFDIALSAVFNAGRYDLGFYAGRSYGLLAASLVLIVLLLQNSGLYVQLARLRDSDRDKAAELLRLSRVDPLTGIANRRCFDEALGQEWRRMMRHQGSLSLLLIDIDYFKRFNDSYGHVAGDECLRIVAQTLAGRARRAGEMAARYGGEEFAVVLRNTELENAVNLANQIRHYVECKKLVKKSTGDILGTISISIGVAQLTADDTQVVFIQRADNCLYAAKNAGRNCVVSDAGAAVDSDVVAA